MELKLDPVPKILGKIKTWNPQTFLVSFKLETDIKILEQKARQAIAKYGVDAVVANELKSRRTQVTIFFADEQKKDCLKLLDPEYDDQISEMIVEHLLYTALGLPQF